VNNSSATEARTAASAHCPICRSRSIRSVLVAPDNGHLRRDDIRLPVWSCDVCDVGFLNPAPEPALGAEYFATAYAEPAKSLYYDDEFKLRVAKIRLDLIEQYRPPGRVLIDVGCGKGQFVRAAREQDWDAYGVELDEGAVATARQTGLSTVFAGSLDHGALPSGADVITLWDVIEHLPDPTAVVRAAHGKLNAGGLLVIRTANFRSWTCERNPHKWWAFGIDHRFYFSPRSLRYLLEREAGFLCRDVRNLEKLERPDKRGAEISIAEGVSRLAKSPSKIERLGVVARQRLRRTLGRMRHGEHYYTSLMTIIAQRGTP
jgi:SAM-dependent methyltransferase